jgi:hypothetical protein
MNCNIRYIPKLILQFPNLHIQLDGNPIHLSFESESATELATINLTINDDAVDAVDAVDAADADDAADAVDAADADDGDNNLIENNLTIGDIHLMDPNSNLFLSLLPYISNVHVK